jgi:polysaccharide export outer membrane protein
MIVGALLAPASEAGAQGKGFNPYSGDTQADSKQPKASDGFSPQDTRAARVPAATGALTPGMTGTDSYKIGRLDIIEISVYGVPELSVTAKVGDDGNLQLPLLGQTPAAGKTAEQLQQELTARLGADYLQNPQVSVLVKEFNSRYVILTGAIKNGVIPLKGETTLLELIAGAGGFSEASDSTVLILREKGGKRLAARFDVSAIEKGRAEDVVLQSGDRIVAGKSVIKQAYSGFLKALPIAGAFMMF